MKLLQCLLVLYWSSCHCFQPLKSCSFSGLHHAGAPSSRLFSKRKQDKDVDASSLEDVDMDGISDAEALLACRAYLQRKNRLGWKVAEQRKEVRDQRRESGFFWETREQMAYWSKREEEDIDFDQDAAVVDNMSSDDENDPNKQPTGIFTEMPTARSAGSEIRSRKKKEEWNDPEFRERWYEARWGKHVKLSTEAKRQQKLQSKLLEIPIAELESPEFAMLTEDEIDEAIRTYVVSNRKRAKARRKKPVIDKEEPEEQNDDDEEECDAKPLPRDLLYATEEDKMREQQRLRSERAAKAYQTRIANEKQKKKRKKRKTAPPKAARKPSSESPEDAAIRVVSDLDANRMPSLLDIQTMMEAPKLSRRKDILRRILGDQFDIRGKVVPRVDGSKTYVTQASVAQLGQFVIATVKESEA